MLPLGLFAHTGFTYVATQWRGIVSGS